jgi:hypothetical protein
MAPKTIPGEVRGKRTDVTPQLSLTPVRIGGFWYIEHAVVDVRDPMLRRWREHRMGFASTMDRRGAYTYSTRSKCVEAISTFTKKCRSKGWI